jgi:hypothetical protein
MGLDESPSGKDVKSPTKAGLPACRAAKHPEIEHKQFRKTSMSWHPAVPPLPSKTPDAAHWAR